ncbi:MAG: hypothetical protein H7Y00_14385 [Fimbriimonadaceae bacterium]|nr:hypothetical protein [Chitinophagales bacterium]
MIATDTTFRLVKSLTKSEKRYFRLFASITEGEKNYMRIFDEMDKQSVYDEKKIKLKFKDKKFVNHFTYEKNYLQQMILKALRNYNTGEELNYIHALADIEILMKKAIPEIALPILKKYKQRTIELENLAEYLVFSRSEMRFAAAMQQTDWFAEYVESGYKKDAEIIDRWKYSLFIITKYNALNILKGKYKFIKNKEFLKELDKMMREPLWNDLFNKVGVKGKIAWFNFFILYNTLLKDYNTAYKYTNDQLAFIKDNNLSIETIGFFNYPALLISNIQTSSILEKYEEVNESCKQLYQLLEGKEYDKVPQIRNQYITTYFTAHINNLALWGKFEKCITFYQDKKEIISALKNSAGNEFIISVNYYLALSYFGLEQYDKALDYINLVLEHKNSEHYAIETVPAQVLYVMIHLELGNREFIMNYLRTFKRYFSKQHIDIKTINALAKIFKEYIAVHHDKKKLQADAKKWLNTIHELQKDKDERIFLRNIMIDKWIMKAVSN